MDCLRRSTLILLCIALFAAAPGRLLADEADAFQLNAAHTGGNDGISFPPNFTAAWTADFDGALEYPVIADGKVFLSVGAASPGSEAYGSRLYALDLNSGAVLWGPVALPGAYFSNNLAYDNGRLFTVNFDGLLKAVDPDTGSILWSLQLGDFSSAPAAYHGVVYVGGANSMYAVNEAKGGVIWSRDLGGDGDLSSPTVAPDGIYVAYAANNIRKLSLTDGSSIWAYPPDGEGDGADTAPLYQGRLYTAGHAGNLILDAATGSAVGVRPAGDQPPVFGGSRMFLMNGFTLEARDLLAKSVEWSFTAPVQSYLEQLLYLDGYVIVASLSSFTSGAVYAIDSSTGQQVWSAPLPFGSGYEYGGTISGLAAAEGHLLVPNGTRLSVFTYPAAPAVSQFTPLYVKGNPVPGTGTANSGIPAGAVWESFGTPALNDGGALAMLAGWSVNRRETKGIFAGGQLISTEGAGTGLADGSNFGTLKDPLFDNLGEVAFLAELKGASVTPANTQSLWTNAWTGAVELVARTCVAAPASGSAPVPGAPSGTPTGAMFERIRSVSLDGQSAGDSTVAFVASLTPGSGGISERNNLGLWVATSQALHLVVRTGDSVTVGATAHIVKSIGALMPEPGTMGQGHGDAHGRIAVLLNFGNRNQAIGQYDANTGAFTLVASTVGTEFVELGLPAQSASGSVAFRGMTPVGHPRGAGLFRLDPTGNLNEEVAKGATMSGVGTIASLEDPVVNGSGDIAFSTSLTQTPGGAGDNEALFWIHSGVLQLLAQKSAQPPGFPAGAEWTSFESLALPESGPGPLFTARVALLPNSPANPTAIKSANHFGLWAAGPSGNVTLLLQTGQFAPGATSGKTVQSFTVLPVVTESTSQTRSYNASGAVVISVIYSDRSAEIDELSR